MSPRRQRSRRADRTSLWPPSKAARLLIVTSLLGTIAFFAVLPFGALYLADVTPYSNTAIGLIIGSVSLVGAVGGILGGHLVDRWGAVPMLAVGLAGSSLVYVAFMVVRRPVLIAALFVVLGVCRFVVEPALKHLMSSHSEDGRVFRLRYMTLCLGAVVGPVIGAALFHHGAVAFFATPAVLYGLFLVLVLGSARTLAPAGPASSGPGLPTGGPFGLALRDRRLLAAILAGTGLFFVFSQLETTVPLTMQPVFGRHTAPLFAGLLVINAVAALVFQPLADYLSTRLRRTVVVAVGTASFALAFVCFALLEQGVHWLYVAVLFWTVGEGILLPMPDMAVHELAQGGRKGVYFGLSELRYLGFFLGPIAGGAMLDGGGGQAPIAYYAVMAVSILATGPVLLLAFARHRPAAHLLEPARLPATEPVR